MFDFLLAIVQNPNGTTPTTDYLEFVKEFYEMAWTDIMWMVLALGATAVVLLTFVGTLVPWWLDRQRGKAFEVKEKELREAIIKALDDAKIHAEQLTADAIEKAETRIAEAKETLQAQQVAGLEATTVAIAACEKAQRRTDAAIAQVNGLLAMTASDVCAHEGNVWGALGQLTAAISNCLIANHPQRDVFVGACLVRFDTLAGELKKQTHGPSIPSILDGFAEVIAKIKARDTPDEDYRKMIEGIVASAETLLEDWRKLPALEL